MIAANLTEYLADPSADLPKPADEEVVLAEIIALHDADAGATFNLYFGDMAEQELYAVSLYPERTAKLAGRSLRPVPLAAFLRKNEDLLRDPRNSIGCWFNEANQATYLDVTATMPDRQKAIELAIRYNQIAIYDLQRGQTIETEGTGEEVSDLPPEKERLPALNRGKRDDPRSTDTKNNS